MVRGFLLGKFMPPHEGHLALCRTAAALCDELTVLVCSRDVEPVPGALRVHVMKQCLPGVRIAWMHRDVPQEPADHPDFWAIWRGVVAEHCPDGVDRVFGSEPYVVRLAAELGAEPVLIDPDRLAFPVSGTAVRNDPARHWKWVPGPLRRWYQKRLVVLGASAPARADIVRHLAAMLDSPYLPAVAGEQGWTASDRSGVSARVKALADVQQARRAAVSALAGPVLVEDTDALMLAARARMVLGEPVTWFEEAFRLADFYFVVEPSRPGEGADTSQADHEGSQLHAHCLAVLARRQARHLVARGSREDLAARAHHALEDLVNEPFPGRWMPSDLLETSNGIVGGWRK